MSLIERDSRFFIHHHEPSSFQIDSLPSVVFTIALASLFLGERLPWHRWVGGGLILSGAVIIALKPV